ncbi:helix-turn-helix transcriptional regulator [Micromonospora sp. NPDC006766]|uniref:helix-turn-helix transcriptional regulator n=1 Tax=Micromonospora sp. NPDC006766 TaxID=3154778 RepID=UPI0033FDBE16
MEPDATGTSGRHDQSAVARFEAGGTVPTLVVLERLARALHMRLNVRFSPSADAA